MRSPTSFFSTTPLLKPEQKLQQKTFTVFEVAKFMHRLIMSQLGAAFRISIVAKLLNHTPGTSKHNSMLFLKLPPAHVEKR